MELYSYQEDAVKRMHNGCLLCGGVGSGKSLTALSYYIRNEKDKDLYIITTARKRDDKEWEDELDKLDLTVKVIDSWNNIKKYTNVNNSFFIFDEQRVVGSGAWVKAFLKITKHNHWILLSATPGDTWSDYIPVFIANGFYKNKTEFNFKHVIYSRFSKYPKIERYLNQGRLRAYRNYILVNMDYKRPAERWFYNVDVAYNRVAYSTALKTRWDWEKKKPIENASELCHRLRKIINLDSSRLETVKELADKHKKVIIFYNFNYELDALKGLDWNGFEVAEWNGHKHEALPKGERYAYLVQYTAGAEGWNCTDTNVIIFYSLNYSYKIMEQAAGRIDRVNTPFTDLYYYRLRSKASIDLAIMRALRQKKKFNESGWVEGK